LDRFGGFLPRTTNFANHGSKVVGAVISAGQLKTVGFDDKLRLAGLETHSYAGGAEISLGGQPVG